MMTMDHFRYLIEVGNRCSINKAAEALYVSQPYLSNLINKIEKEVGYAIFIRTKTATFPTKEGQIFLDFASRILKEYETILNIPSLLAGGEKISCAAIYSKSLMQLFFEFQKQHPLANHEDTFFESSMDDIFNLIIRGLSNMGLIAFPKEDFKKYETFLHQNHLCLKVLCARISVVAVFAASSPLSGKKKLSIDQLKEYPFVYYTNWKNSDLLKLLGLNEQSNILVVSDRGSYLDAIETGGYVSASIGINRNVFRGKPLCSSKISGYEDRLFLGCVYSCRRGLNKRETEFSDFLKRQLNSPGAYL